MSETVSRPDIEAIAARAEAANNMVADCASDPRKFRMSIPPQSYDTDILVHTVCIYDVPALVAYALRLEAELAQYRSQSSSVGLEGYSAANLLPCTDTQAHSETETAAFGADYWRTK